jgi:uncharacterized protein (DUF2267 family)
MIERIKALRKELPSTIYDVWTGDPKHYDSYAMEQSAKVADAAIDAVLVVVREALDAAPTREIQKWGTGTLVAGIAPGTYRLLKEEQ